MEANSYIPREKGVDHTLTLLSEGYQFIPNRCRRYDSDIFETRLMGQKVICMSGKEAAEVFYDNERFKRKGAAPKRVQKTLFGKNGVQTMDGPAHKHRKELFMSLMTPDRLEKLNDFTIQQWNVAIDKWGKMDQVVLMDEAREIMLRVACQWAGVKLWARELKLRTNDLGAMVDAFGAVGPRFWQGRQARIRTESWIRNMIRQVRNGELHPPNDTPLYAIAWHKDLNNQLLSTKMAAVELINILRPIVAIARYVTFGALAMLEHPICRVKLQSAKKDYSKMFVQETRRYYPFGPFVGARVRKTLHGIHTIFRRGF
ncbi:fatty-acid peroxygenase [Halobacillus karajensis]|uniref:cytochrome P450 n=1 Tax=Halobacillus karajensis TaxID=195088 RepID=UPI0008A737A1|nr:fatty-acid peroxygenase [Halobacillus karajensis]